MFGAQTIVGQKMVGAATGTAACITSVALHGQVIMSVFTSHEGQGLLTLITGLVNRYEVVRLAPPTTTDGNLLKLSRYGLDYQTMRNRGCPLH